MPTIILRAVQGIAVTGSVWIGYNMLIFADIAAGAKMKYIPYLHFPIKLFVSALS
jgi:hypothetical protein